MLPDRDTFRGSMGPLRPNRRLILAALVLAGAVLLVTVAGVRPRHGAGDRALRAGRPPGHARRGPDRPAPLGTPRAAPGGPLAAQRLYDALVPHRSGRLIASGLAVRPPPAAPLLTTS